VPIPVPTPTNKKPVAKGRSAPVSGVSRRRDTAKAFASPGYLARRSQLLEAAAKVFRKKGYSRTKLTEVADEAGVERANLYYYVANKRELFLEVLQHYLVFESNAQLDAATGAGSAADRLRLLMIDLMRRYHEHYPYAYIASQENLSFLSEEEETQEIAAQIKTLGQRQFDALRQVLEEGIRSREFASTLSIGLLTEAVVGLLAWSTFWFDPTTSRHSGADIGAGFADLLLNGLLNPALPPAALGKPIG
jgi:AcrR family transcriptional regulator